MSKYCVYGGQFGSEGKGCVAEWIIKNWMDRGKSGRKLVVFGENGPNSGHTNTLTKTRNLPVSSIFADAVIMGPDSTFDLEALQKDRLNVMNRRNPPQIYIHENAGVFTGQDREAELSAELEKRISSTCSGHGMARVTKYFLRLNKAVAKNHSTWFSDRGFCLVNTSQYLSLLRQLKYEDWVAELSQGLLLDTNFGYYPYVTSRTTLPRVALYRNGLGDMVWSTVGVFRPHPIRTGGPSGPTGGKEISWDDLGVEQEIATVTKRIRRVFEWSSDDFNRSLTLNCPDHIFFTHCDYLKKNAKAWLKSLGDFGVKDIRYSVKPAKFNQL